LILRKEEKMNILKFSDNENLKKMLKKHNGENLGVTYELNKKYYFSCTCGTGYELLNSGCESKCLKCGTPLVLSYMQPDEEGAVLVHNIKVLQDDDEFFIVRIDAEGVVFEDYKMHTESEEDEDLVFVYDKKKKLFFPIVLSTLSFEDAEFHGTISYTSDGVFNSKGEEIGRVTADECDISFSESLCMYNCIQEPFIQHCGIVDFIEMFCNAAGIELKSGYKVDTISEAVIELISRINFGYVRDKEYFMRCPSWLDPYRHRTNIISFYFGLADEGINLQASSFKDAFGISFDKIVKLSGMESIKATYDMLNKEGLSEFSMHLIDRIDVDNWKSIFDISNKVGIDVDTIIKHVARAKGVSPNEALHNVWYISNHLDAEDTKRLLNFNAPYKANSMIKYHIVSSGKLTIEQYEEVLKKPTLDTFIKVVGL